MANLIAARGAQTVLNAEFTFNFDDQMVTFYMTVSKLEEELTNV
jgi:hypothetical protein